MARSGDRFSGFCSGDGQTWTVVGTVRVRMSPTAHVGMACATLLNHAVLGTTFDHLRLMTQAMGPAEGIGLVDGSLLAARLKRLNQESLHYEDAAGTERKLPANAVAYVVTRPLPADVRHALAERKPGLSLSTGDQMESVVQGFRDGTFSVESLLFGRQNVPLSQVVAAVLRPAQGRAAFSVSARDGSIYRGTRVSTAAGLVTIEGGVMGAVVLKPEAIAEMDFDEPEEQPARDGS